MRLCNGIYVLSTFDEDLSKFLSSQVRFWHISRYGLCSGGNQCINEVLKKKKRASHLLLLLMVVVAGRFVSRSRKVVRSITLVVHHIQAAHSDQARCSARSSRRREALSPLRAHTGRTPGAVGASIYAQTHTMAIPPDNAPPAEHCAAGTPGNKKDRKRYEVYPKNGGKDDFWQVSGALLTENWLLPAARLSFLEGSYI